jgi:hypothetical protein
LMMSSSGVPRIAAFVGIMRVGGVGVRRRGWRNLRPVLSQMTVLCGGSREGFLLVAERLEGLLRFCTALDIPKD